MAFRVVAPCRGPIVHTCVPRCIPHHTPTYFCGTIHEVSSIFEGSFRLSTSDEFIRPTALSAICIVRQGVVKRPGMYAFTPSGRGARSAFSTPALSRLNTISGQSYRAASCTAPNIPSPVRNVKGVFASVIRATGCSRYWSS